jgi:hypothetical protein
MSGEPSTSGGVAAVRMGAPAPDLPLTFSITQGMLWGFLSHVVLYLLAGRRAEIRPMMYGICALSVALLVLQSRGA